MASEENRPAEPKRLYQVVADQIRQDIQSGRFPMLSRLPAERELAQMLGVSRPSLREALIVLELGGVVEIRMGSGIYVTGNQTASPSVGLALGESPSEIMQARVAIESAVVVLACARMTPADLVTLRSSLDSMNRAIAAGAVPLEQDRAFHGLIAERSGNAVLTNIIRDLFDARRGLILTTISRKAESTTTWQAAATEHEAIVAALEARDPLWAETAMRTHLQRSAERWLGP